VKLGIIDGHDVRVQLGVLDPVSEGGLFDVVCIRPGEANGVEFSAGVLQDAVNLFENANVFVDHGGFFEANRSVKDLAGVITQVRYQAEKGITGRLRLMTPSGWLEGFLRQLVADRDQGLAVPRVGLSADLYIRRKGVNVEEIRRVNSVDIVFDPAAGGSFERVLNSVGQTHLSARHGGDEMDEEVRESGSVGGVGEGVQDVQPVQPPLNPSRGTEQGGGSARSDEALVMAAAQGMETIELRRVQCSAVLQSVLAANSDLPPAMTDLLEIRFKGGIFDAADLQAEVAAVRKAWADLQESSVIQGMGTGSDGSRSGDLLSRSGDLRQPRVRGMWDSLDRIQMAFDRLMGLEIPGEHSDLPRLTGIRELYLLLTGDHEMYGRFNPDRVQLTCQVTTSTITSVVKNALNKVLLKSYNMRPQWWAPIAYEEDFNTLNDVTWITLGGIADLDEVSEGAAYTEKSWSDNEETSSFTKMGNYIGITLESIDRDNVAAIKQLPQKLGLAAARTLSGTISALFTAQSGTGPDLSDSKALFHTDHSNLLTAALSTSAWDAVIQAMFKQAEATSSKRIGVRPATILVPIELEKTALTIINSPNEPGTGDNDINVRQGSARVIAVPEWTDSNNWAACASPLDLPGVCVGYRFGRAPEMFVADSDVVGSMFTNDEMRIKVRFFYAVGIGDYRALHKNNVA